MPSVVHHRERDAQKHGSGAAVVDTLLLVTECHTDEKEVKDNEGRGRIGRTVSTSFCSGVRECFSFSFNTCRDKSFSPQGSQMRLRNGGEPASESFS